MSNQKEPTAFYDPKTIDISDRTDLADDEYYVEKVVKKRIGNNYQLEYLIKWVDYPSSANTWESIENVDKSAELIKEFEEENLKNASTNRARKAVPAVENLSRTMIDDQIKALIESPEDIHDVIGFIPSASRFIILWKSGYILEMPSTYLNRLSAEKKKLFMNCLANLQEDYVKYNMLKADPILMAGQLKKMQAAKGADKEKRKSKTEGEINNYQSHLAGIKKWLAVDTDDEEMSDEELSEEEEDEEEEDEKTKNKKILKEKCVQMYLKGVTLKQKNACKAYLEKHYKDEENSSDSEESDEESDVESLKDFENNNDLEEEETELVIRIEKIEPENNIAEMEIVEEENNGTNEIGINEEEVNLEEVFEEGINVVGTDEEEEEEDESEQNFKKDEDKKEKEELACFVAGATAAAEAIEADVDSGEEIIFPQEALFPASWLPKATSSENFPKPSSSKSPAVPMEIDDSRKRKTPSPEYPPFEQGPSTSTGSRGIGLPSYIDLKRLTTFSDSDSD